MQGRLTPGKYPKNVANNAVRGKTGESQAALFLEKKGMKPICHNFRCNAGEIDLIALDEGVLVFVEIKNWHVFGQENLRFGINQKKQRRIIETAKYFLSLHREYSYRSIRFDVVFLRPGQPIFHLISAFTESQ